MFDEQDYHFRAVATVDLLYPYLFQRLITLLAIFFVVNSLTLVWTLS